MSQNDLDDEEERGFFARFGVPLVIGAMVLGGGVFIVPGLLNTKSKPARVQEFSMVQIAPPPAPPPPPPPPPPPKMEEKEPPKEEMIAQEAVQENEPPPEAPTPDEPPPGEALGTAITGDGPPDGFGLGGPGGNGGRGGNGLGGSGRKGGNQFSYYASQVGRSIKAALDGNRKTNRLSFPPTKIRVWTDETGRISRIKLAKSTGDPAADRTLENEMIGVRVSQPQPAGMPQPIVLQVDQQRPN